MQMMDSNNFSTLIQQITFLALLELPEVIITHLLSVRLKHSSTLHQVMQYLIVRSPFSPDLKAEVQVITMLSECDSIQWSDFLEKEQMVPIQIVQL